MSSRCFFPRTFLSLMCLTSHFFASRLGVFFFCGLECMVSGWNVQHASTRAGMFCQIFLCFHWISRPIRSSRARNRFLHCQCHSQPLLLAVIFEFVNSNSLALCSTHSQHIRKHICNNFPHLHNVNRGLETITNREKQVFALPVPQSAVATSRYF